MNAQRVSGTRGKEDQVNEHGTGKENRKEKQTTASKDSREAVPACAKVRQLGKMFLKY